MVLSARWYSCPRMPNSYGWRPLTQAGSLVKSVLDHYTCFTLCHTDLPFAAGGSMPGQDEDISPYATFHLLGMREEVSFNFQRILFAILPSKVT